jgi:hypothetical protein
MHSSINSSIAPSNHIYIHPCIHLYFYISIYLPIYLSIYLLIYLSTYPSIYVGYFYQYGIGTPIDLQACTMYYRRAADQGNMNAQYNLGARDAM